jgi:hypothetical protein
MSKKHTLAEDATSKKRGELKAEVINVTIDDLGEMDTRVLVYETQGQIEDIPDHNPSVVRVKFDGPSNECVIRALNAVIAWVETNGLP